MICVLNKKILIKQGNLTEEMTDAIVNPANSRLQHGGGAAKAISKGGGPIIDEQSQSLIRRIGEVPVSKAVITDAGALPCKFVIHTVGPMWGEGEETAKLRRAVWNVLALAELYNLRSLSMPAISSGVFGFPKPLCAQVLLDTTRDFLQRPGITLEEVFMCNIDAETVAIFQAEEEALLTEETTE
jgi:O-acetyl-ADP-ribose deacetylase